ncbi:MAG: Maf family protein [Rhodospirillales bacterium]
MSAASAIPAGPELWLASASKARAALLRQAGIEPRIEPAGIDEGEIKASLRARGADAAQAVEALAELKATRVSRRHAGALVLGADQMLACEGQWSDKPRDMDDARRQLAALRGRRHELFSAACVVRDGARLWHHGESAGLSMRRFSDDFLDAYLKAVGADALNLVGAYALEGPGVQLFARVEGDFFGILGLPLLPLLDFLRSHGVART